MMYFIYLLAFIVIYFNFYVLAKSYADISGFSLKINKFDRIILLIVSVISFINNYYVFSVFKIFVSFILIFIEFKFIFKEKVSLTLFKLFIIYLILLLIDSIISITSLILSIDSIVGIGHITIIRILYTILDSMIMLVVFTFKSFINFLNKLIDFMNSQLNKMVLLIVSLLCITVFILAYLNAYNFNAKMFFICLCLMGFFLFLCVLLIFEYFKNKSAKEEQQALIDLMEEYEKMLEKDRINRHEMLNNLIVLKSNKNKSSTEYENLLDDIINEYQFKKSNFYAKLSKLPSGIKGIIYYKLANIEVNDIDFSLIISDEIKENLEMCNSKLYYKICKILGILIDNALEATVQTNDKVLIIDMYKENGNIVVYIENSFVGNIELTNIENKGYSTKGKNRGYGLYIVKKIIKESNDFVFNQFINESNRFVSVLEIKNSSF